MSPPRDGWGSSAGERAVASQRGRELSLQRSPSCLGNEAGARPQGEDYASPEHERKVSGMGGWTRRAAVKQACAICGIVVAHYDGEPHYQHKRGKPHLAALRARAATS